MSCTRLNHELKHEEVTIGDITIGTNGYVNVSLGTVPVNKVVAITVGYFGTVSAKTAISAGFSGNTAYILGNANATVNNLTLHVLYWA